MIPIDELLQDGIKAARAGQSVEAHRILRQIVEQDPHNEIAWLWLSSVVETDEQRRVCLENVLAINPSSQAAQRGLAFLQQKAAAVKPLPEMTPEPPPVEKPKSILSHETLGCSIALAALLVVIVAWALVTGKSLGGKGKSPVPVPKSTPTPIHLSIGEQGILHVDGGSSSHWVAANEEAFEKLLDAVNAKDDYGMSELLLTGQVFSIKDGTKVLVIDETLSRIKIRILEGSYTGQSGWVPDEFVVPQ